ncbi:MAG: protein of unknown functin DUF2007 [Idiomarinaceae bacterium HL-53]|nr:MAG: protein of unknown functin DUF2007 [Idiomarinaceae bacterium HL-53]CUS49166.1 Putative signal transducing protein [Idiomarinaceae bacterium HL-53]
MPQAKPTWTQVYLAASPVEANLLVGLLEAEGITAGMRGHGLTGGLGELPMDALQTPIYAPPNQHEKAKQVLRNYEQNTGTEWTCNACGELNGSEFEICWSCQAEPKEC